MKKSLLTLLILFICTFQRSVAYEYFVIYFSDGTKSEAFYASDVESIGYSKTDLNGIERDSWQVQEIQTIDSLYRFPLASIRYLDFKEGDMNKVIEDIGNACTAITPIYAQCESINDIAHHLSEIKSAEGVEDAWISNQTLYVKIKDWETITYDFPPEDGEFDGIFAQEALSQFVEPAKAPDGWHEDYTEDIKNVCVINQQYRDESRESRRISERSFINLCKDWRFNVEQVDEPSPKFFLEDIYNYDYVFLMTHGCYDTETGRHWLLTGEQLYVANEYGFVDINVIWSKVREIFEKKYSIKKKKEYPLNMEDEDFANYLSFGFYKEKRGESKVPVFYSTISDKWIASAYKQFKQNGIVVVFNTACQSLMGNDNLAQAFFKRGAGQYIGYNETAHWGHVAGNGFFSGLLNGKSSFVSYLSIPKRFRDYSFDDEDRQMCIHTVLRRVVNNPKDENDICITRPTTLEAGVISSGASSKYVLNGEMDAYRPLCNFYVDNSYNKEVYKNTYGFLISDMTDATTITVDIKSDDISNNHVSWKAVIDEQDLQPNTTYYYCAYMNDGLYDCYGDFKQITTKEKLELYTIWDEENKTVTIYYDGNRGMRGSTFLSLDDKPKPYLEKKCEKVVFDPTFANYYPEATDFWFSGCKKLKTIENIQYLNTSNVTDMSSMFWGCESLTNLDLSSFNTANVTNMGAMFFGCTSLTNIDLSSFDTSNVTDMGGMFCDCSSLTSLDLSSFDMSNVTDIMIMFDGCTSLTSLDFRNLCLKDDGGVGLFSDLESLQHINLENANTANATDMSSMFDGCTSLTSLDLSSFDTSNVTDMDWMFSGCSSLTSLDLSSFDTSNVWIMQYMFSDCTSLTSIDFRNLYLKDNVGKGLFSYIKNLQYINLENANTANATDMSSMFEGCTSLKSLDLSSFDTSNVTDMGWMFSGCSSLTSLDLSNFNMAKVRNNNHMFKDCSSLASLNVRNLYLKDGVGVRLFQNLNKLQHINLENVNTVNATDMSGMFSGCTSLTSLDLSSFNTSNVTDMSSMFNDCSSLTSLDLGGFNTSNVTEMDEMFDGCTSLTSLDLGGFNTSNVTDMDWMFDGCTSLTSLDLSSFDTSNVKYMSSMFSGCSSLKSLDLSSFNMTNKPSMREMFSGCSSLKTIYAGNWEVGNNYVPMFKGCDNLVGGKGTKVGETLYGYEEDGDPLYYWCSSDSRAAHIDGGKNWPGLFTAK